MKTKIAVLVSGGGTNLQALIDAEKRGCLHSGKISLVISNNSIAYALKRAEENGIPHLTITKKACGGKKEAEEAMLRALEEHHIDLIILAGFLLVVPPFLINKYDHKIINLHPALLPKYGGRGMYGHHVHEAVLAAGEKESGCTIHLVDDGCDTGTILLQKKVPVMPGDTPETLYARIAPEEHKAMVEGLVLLAERLA